MDNEKPTFSGHVLLNIIHEIYKETGLMLNSPQVAEALDVPLDAVTGIVDGRTHISADLALRLSKAFPCTTPEMWICLQGQCDLAKLKMLTPPQRVRVLWEGELSALSDIAHRCNDTVNLDK